MSRSNIVYFVKRADGLVKIGHTAHLDRRLSILEKSHGPLDVVRIVNGDRSREKQIHTLLADHHEFGEWFRDGPKLRDAIASLPNGKRVDVIRNELDRKWAAGEQELADTARSLLRSLVKVRSDRSKLPFGAALTAVCSDYGLKHWPMDNLYRNGVTTVSAYTFQRIKAAALEEMHLARQELEQYEALMNEGRAEEVAARLEAATRTAKEAAE